MTPVFGAPLPPPPPPGAVPVGYAPTQAAPFGGMPPMAYAQAPGAWTPPPKPGLIPLAPLTLGVMLGASFRILRRNPQPILLISLVISVISSLVTVLLTSNLVGTLSQSLGRLASGQQSSPNQVSGLLLADLSAFAGIALVYIGRGVLQGFVSLDVSSGAIGERLPIRAFFAGRGRRIGALVGWSVAVVASVIVFSIVVIALVTVLIGLAVASQNGGSIGGSIVGSIVIFLGAAVLLIWLLTKLSMVPSILMVERMTLGKAIGRSWRLTRKSFWRVFGIELLVSFIVYVAQQIIQGPIQFIGVLLITTSHPTGTSVADQLSGLSTFSWISGGVDAIVMTVLSVVFAASVALLYVDLRIRREGLDLGLIQYVDARAAGATDLDDPFTTPAQVP